ncbi:Helix-hairpin-helix domain-containing protein, partial [Halogeometricum rufum]
MSDDDSESRLTVVCRDGTTIGCTNFKAIESGVLLTEDLKKNRVFGFVSADEVRFVLPTERARDLTEGGQTADDDGFDDPLMQLPGLGSTYAKRLRSAGYASVEDLAGADPETLVEETGANDEQAAEWVEQARLKSDDTASEEADEDVDEEVETVEDDEGETDEEADEGETDEEADEGETDEEADEGET